MVKSLFIIICLMNLLFCTDNSRVYEKNCVKCHRKLPVSIDKFFYRYLLKYSGQREVKKNMFIYLRQPSKNKTIMPESFIKRFGVKKKTKLSIAELKEALDDYWEKYKVFGKLK